MYCVLDIETYKDQNSKLIEKRLEVTEQEKELVGQVMPNKNIKDPKKIKVNLEKKRKEFLENIEKKKNKIIEKAALSPLTGRLISVGLGFRDDKENWTFKVKLIKPNENELGLLNWLDTELVDSKPVTQYLVTYNGRDFDLPFIVGRALINNYGFVYPVGKFTTYKCHFDIFKILQSGKLPEWHTAITGESHTLKGSDVAALVEAEQWKEIEQHNLEDVQATANLFDRLENVMGVMF